MNEPIKLTEHQHDLLDLVAKKLVPPSQFAAVDLGNRLRDLRDLGLVEAYVHDEVGSYAATEWRLTRLGVIAYAHPEQDLGRPIAAATLPQDAPGALEAPGIASKPAETIRWRTGRSVHNTIYHGDTFVGSCITPGFATALVTAANRGSLPMIEGVEVEPIVRVEGTDRVNARAVWRFEGDIFELDRRNYADERDLAYLEALCVRFRAALDAFRRQ